MVGQLALQGGAVPALVSQLMLTLMNGHLDTLQGRCRHIRAAHTQAHLALTQASQSQAHRVRGQNRVACHLQAQYVIAQHPGRKGDVRARGCVLVLLRTRPSCVI